MGCRRSRHGSGCVGSADACTWRASPTGVPAGQLSAKPTTTTGCAGSANTTIGRLCRLHRHSGVVICPGVSASTTPLQCRLCRRLCMYFYTVLYNAVHIFICFLILFVYFQRFVLFCCVYVYTFFICLICFYVCFYIFYSFYILSYFLCVCVFWCIFLCV